MRPRVGVLALQGGVEEHLASLRKVGADAVKVRRQSELEGLDAVIIPGGESTTMSKLLVATEMYRPLRDLIRSGCPVWGTCAGMILLAKTVVDGLPDQVSFDAIDAVVRRNAFGSQIQSHEEKLVVEGVDEPVHAVFIRAPIVESVGPDVRVLARSQRHGGSQDAESQETLGPIVAISEGPVLATSFHPELSDDVEMHRYFLERFVVDAEGH